MSARVEVFQVKLHGLMEKLTPESGVWRQCQTYLELYQDSAAYLADPKHALAFIGKIGAGKTTAICHLFGLLDDKGKELLSTGSGRTTLCEVEIRHGGDWAVELEPHSREEVEAYLKDFCQYLLPAPEEEGAQPESDDMGFKLSAEVDRALRNLLDLKRVRSEGEDGKSRLVDPAQELLKAHISADDCLGVLTERFGFDKRTKTAFSFSASDTDQSAEIWLRNKFKAINHGTEPETGLAKRIVITCPLVPAMVPGLDIRVIDTKGVDQTVDRSDLDRCLENRRTISIICSSFPDAPDKVCEGVLRNIKTAGQDEHIEDEVVLMVLDKDREAENVIDIDEPVGDCKLGREIKLSQIKESIARGISSRVPDILFFNSYSDSASAAFSQLKETLRRLRQRHEDNLNRIEAAVNEIARDVASQTAEEAKRRVRETLEPWLKDASTVVPAVEEAFAVLVQRIAGSSTYAASVRASVNRRGAWTNLDYYRDLGVAARAQVAGKIGPARDQLYALIDNMLKQPTLQPAYALLKQVRELVQKRMEGIQDEAVQLGRAVYESDLRGDTRLWQNLMEEWGQGPGYKMRVARGSREWFELHNYPSYEKKVTDRVLAGWASLIDEIDGLLSD